jgi:hypothetical protein
LLALFAAATLGFRLGERQETYPRYKAAQGQQIEPQPASRLHVQPLEYKRPCQNPQSESESDLCAQYRSAASAEEAAEWAFWQFFLSLFGVAGLIGTIVLTVRATNAAVRANEIAGDTAKRQLRAYISVEPRGVNAPDRDGLVRVPLFIKNCGQTPAYSVMVFQRFALFERPNDFDPTRLPDRGLSAEASDIVFGPGEGNYVYPYIRANFLADNMAAIAEQKKALIHFGSVSYVDAFGEGRETNFAFFHWGDELTDHNSKRCRLGNTAT